MQHTRKPDFSLVAKSRLCDSQEAGAETWRQMKLWAEEEEGKSGGWWAAENEAGGLVYFAMPLGTKLYFAAVRSMDAAAITASARLSTNRSHPLASSSLT